MKNGSETIYERLFYQILLSAHPYSMWAAEVKRRDEMPYDGAAALTRDLLKYQEQTGAFPEDLRRLVGRVWDAKKQREFDPSGKVFQHNNAFYLYTGYR